jgi:regulator of replication initiation timing
MNNEELIKENTLLKEENEKLKKQLESYNNSRKAYYENDIIIGVKNVQSIWYNDENGKKT